jgi:hypothetical protein
MKTYTIEWHNEGTTELGASAERAEEVLGVYWPGNDDRATPHEILAELDASIETPRFSLWQTTELEADRKALADADAARTVSVLSRIQKHQREVRARIINHIRSKHGR